MQDRTESYFISVVFFLPSFPIPISPNPFNGDDGDMTDPEGECAASTASPEFCLTRRRLFLRPAFFGLFSSCVPIALSDRLKTDMFDMVLLVVALLDVMECLIGLRGNTGERAPSMLALYEEPVRSR